MQPQMMGGIIQVNIPDKATLQASYMPFVQGGGLFVPTKQAVKMGQEVFILATLPDQSQKIPLTGNYKEHGTYKEILKIIKEYKCK